MSRRRDAGVALVAAVGALALMTAMAVRLAHTTVLDQRRADDALASLQADALARSGIAVAAVVLAETNAADGPDTLHSPWALDAGRQPLGAGWVEVGIDDEARRLDVNAPELADALPRLLAGLGLDPFLADAIADWTDADDVPRAHGAERSAYRDTVPRNGAVATVGELGLVRGVDAHALERLRPYVTVAGEHAVNPNTASREVLLAVVEDPALAESLLVARAQGPLADDDLDRLVPAPAVRSRLVTRGQRYRVRAVAGVRGVRRGVDATVWAPGGVYPEVAAWRPFVPTDTPPAAAPSSR